MVTVRVRVEVWLGSGFKVSFHTVQISTLVVTQATF